MERRTLVQAIGASALAGLGGCAGLSSQFEGGPNGSNGSTDSNTEATEAVETTETTDDQSGNTAPAYSATTPDGAVATASVPADPSEFTYPTMGSADAPVSVTFYGSWKCPYTQEFVNQQFDELVQRYVRPGEVSVTFRSVGYKNGSPFLGPDAPRAARAGLAVWNADPKSFWRYFATVFASQPPEGVEWATVNQLAAFMSAANVGNVSKIRSGITSNARSKRVRATTEAARRRGIETVPRLVIDGEIHAPNLNWQATLDALNAAVRDA